MVIGLRTGCAVAMAAVVSAPQALRIGRTSSPLCCSSACASASASASSSSAHSSYARGGLLRRGRLSNCCGSSSVMQRGGGIGIFRDYGGAGRIRSTEEEMDDKRVVRSRAAGGRREGDGVPLYEVSDDSNGYGPIELPPREIEIDPFAVPDASPAQIVASVVLTGAIAVLSYRALRRRAERSKNMQFRASGINPKSIKEEARQSAIDNLTKAPEITTPPPSPGQTLLGAVVAGVIALGLYKFTSTVEAGFNVKAVSQDYSIRNLTITVRTIITGLCYLATFVFAANSIGLTLYAFQLLLGIGVAETPNPKESFSQEESKTEEKLETEDLSEK